MNMAFAWMGPAGGGPIRSISFGRKKVAQRRPPYGGTAQQRPDEIHLLREKEGRGELEDPVSRKHTALAVKAMMVLYIKIHEHGLCKELLRSEAR